MTVAALLTEQNGHLLVDALDALPESMRAAIVPLGQQLMQEGAAHPELGHPEHARLIVSIPTGVVWRIAVEAAKVWMTKLDLAPRCRTTTGLMT